MKKRVTINTQVYQLYRLLKTISWGLRIVSWTQYLAMIHELTVGESLGAKIGPKSRMTNFRRMLNILYKLDTMTHN